MGKKRFSYRRLSHKSIGKNATDQRLERLICNINDKKVNILNDYIDFFKNLDRPEDFKNYSSKIVPYSPQWNEIRRKHVTASEIKRVLSWKKESPYIFRQISKYINGKNPNRGVLLEPHICKLIEMNGYNLKYQNQIWIHKLLPWLSCTTDAVIVNGTKLVAAVEIKTFTSLESMKKVFYLSNGEYKPKTDTRIYYQLQTICEILNVPYILLVFEYNLKIRKVLIERDLDFIWNKFDRLKELYLTHIVSYYLYGVPPYLNKGKSKYLGHFNRYTYLKLEVFLKKKEHLFRDNSESSIFEFYPHEKPSNNKDEYFDLFGDKLLRNKLMNQPFEFDNLEKICNVNEIYNLRATKI